MLYPAGVYAIWNTRNGKRYIGSSTRLSVRWNTHKRQLANDNHHSTILQRAWNKYGADAFEFQVLAYCAPEDCLFFEQRFLSIQRPEYNMILVAGSTLGMRHSRQTKDKMRDSHMGHVVTQTTKDRIRESQQGSLGNNAKLTEDDVREIRVRIQNGEKQVTLAKEFGVSTPTITDIKNRKSWRHV